jgi:protein-S-isoprenylcysteine O-methyltransferase Ste14
VTTPTTDQPRTDAARKGVGLRAFLRDVRERRWRFRQFMNVLYFVAILLVASYEPPHALWSLVAGACLAIAGIAVRLWASGCIKKNDALATDGPYAFVRHPLYVGNFLIGTGFALASGHVLAVILWFLLFYYYHTPAIEREDGKLRRKFPETWPDWAKETPALLPLALFRMRKRPQLGPWSLRQSLRNGEPLYAVVLLCGLFYLSSLLA